MGALRLAAELHDDEKGPVEIINLIGNKYGFNMLNYFAWQAIDTTFLLLGVVADQRGIRSGE